LRIADQDHGFRRLRGRQHVCKRHLRRFIHEEHVHALQRFRCGPEPDRPSGNHRGVPKGGEDLLVALNDRKARLRVPRLGGLLTAVQIEALLFGRVYGLIDQMANDLVAVRRNADGSPTTHPLADHVRARESLAGAGRSLDRKNAAG